LSKVLKILIEFLFNYKIPSFSVFRVSVLRFLFHFSVVFLIMFQCLIYFIFQFNHGWIKLCDSKQDSFSQFHFSPFPFTLHGDWWIKARFAGLTHFLFWHWQGSILNFNVFMIVPASSYGVCHLGCWIDEYLEVVPSCCWFLLLCLVSINWICVHSTIWDSTTYHCCHL